MYERPPSFEPERSRGERALAIAPLLALVVGGGVLSFLLLAYMSDPLDISLVGVLKRIARNEQAIASTATSCFAVAVWICQQRRSNTGLLIGLRVLLLMSFAFLIFTMRH